MSTFTVTESAIDALAKVAKEDDDALEPFQRRRRSDRRFLARFVRTAKGDVDRALTRLRSFEKLERDHISDRLPFLSVLQVRRALAEGVGTMVGVTPDGTLGPILSRNGAATLFCAFSSIDYEVVPPHEMITTFYYLFERLMRTDGAQVGLCFLAEADGVGWKQFNLEVERIFIQFLSNTMPIRLESMVLVNEPFLIKAMVAMVRPFMSQKVRDRMVFVGSQLDLLLEHFDEKNLLERYGGSLRLATGPETSWYLLQQEMERVKVKVSAEAAGATFARDPTLNNALVCTTPGGPFLLDDVVLAVNGKPVTADTTLELPGKASKVTVGRVNVDVLGRKRGEVSSAK